MAKKKNMITATKLARIAKPVQTGKRTSELPADLQLVYRELQTALAETFTRQLRGHYRIGEIVHDCLERSARKEGQRRHDSRIVKQLAEALGVQSSLLYKCRQLAERYSPSEIDAVVQRALLNWTHFVALLTVDDTGQRKAYEQAAEAEHLTAEALRKRIIADRGNLRPGSGRRPTKAQTADPAIARDPDQVEDELAQTADQASAGTLEQALEKVRCVTGAFNHLVSDMLPGGKIDLVLEMDLNTEPNSYSRSAPP